MQTVSTYEFEDEVRADQQSSPLHDEGWNREQGLIFLIRYRSLCMLTLVARSKEEAKEVYRNAPYWAPSELKQIDVGFCTDARWDVKDVGIANASIPNGTILDVAFLD